MKLQRTAIVPPLSRHANDRSESRPLRGTSAVTEEYFVSYNLQMCALALYRVQVTEKEPIRVHYLIR